ncbi:MAG: diguanylate cyclase domain-containing protein [Desulfovibrio sp.]
MLKQTRIRDVIIISNALIVLFTLGVVGYFYLQPTELVQQPMDALRVQSKNITSHLQTEIDKRYPQKAVATSFQPATFENLNLYNIAKSPAPTKRTPRTKACPLGVGRIGKVLTTMGASSGGYFFVLNSDNKLVADSSGSFFRPKPLSESTLSIATTLPPSGNELQPESLVEREETRYALFVSPIQSEQTTLTLYSLFPVATTTATPIAYLPFFIILVVSLIITAIVGYLISRRITGPLRELSFIISETAQGNYQAQYNEERGDEIGELANAVNRMTETLQIKKSKLQQDFNTSKTSSSTDENEVSDITTKDALTGLTSRYHFNKIFDQEWRRHLREGKSFSMIHCDIDQFRIYNETYGNDAGDKCLKAVADVLKSIFKRPGDIVARYDGEEFSVILPATPLSGADHMAHTIKDAIAKLEIPYKEADKGIVTICVGVASIIPTNDVSQQTFLKDIENTLEEAKNRSTDSVAIKMYPMAKS